MSTEIELFPGISLYRDVLPESLNIVNRLESAINKSNKRKDWQKSQVGYRTVYKNYRDCQDIKINKKNKVFKTEYEEDLESIWQDVYDRQKPIIDQYCSKYNMVMNYWESMNFIKYGPGQHFQEHSDHGYSYICTVSIVSYLNDDYEGGELLFNKLNIKHKPKIGDMLVFPSTYLFSHTALPVQSGLKYSIATMLDYEDRNTKSSVKYN